MATTGEFGRGKTIFVLAIVIGCFAVLWPKIFYPMLTASISQTQGDNAGVCCDVISVKDTNAYKVLNEICTNIMRKEQMVQQQQQQQQQKTPVKAPSVTLCRNEILQTCGVDIIGLLKEDHSISIEYKKSLLQLRSFNTSLCMKLNYGIEFREIGLPRKIKGPDSAPSHMRPERPFRPGPDMIHPALRERGRAIPTVNIPRRTIEREARPGPVPGMRPPVGGAGHIPSAPKGGGTMGIIMPMYTIGIVCFFLYTIMKILFKKSPAEPEPVKPPQVKDYGLDPEHRKFVFSEEYAEGSERSMKEAFHKEDRDLGLKRRSSGGKSARLYEDRRRLEPPTVIFPTYPSDLQTDPETSPLTSIDIPSESVDSERPPTPLSTDEKHSEDITASDDGTQITDQTFDNIDTTFELELNITTTTLSEPEPTETTQGLSEDIRVPFNSYAKTGEWHDDEPLHDNENEECISETTTAGTVTGFSEDSIPVARGSVGDITDSGESDILSKSVEVGSIDASDRPMLITDVSICSSADTIVADSGPMSEAEGEVSTLETIATPSAQPVPIEEKVEHAPTAGDEPKESVPGEEAKPTAVIEENVAQASETKVQSTPPRSDNTDSGPFSPLAPEQTPDGTRLHFFDRTIVIPDYEPEAGKQKQGPVEPAPPPTADEEPQITIVKQETVPQSVLDMAEQVAEKILEDAKSELVSASSLEAPAPGESMIPLDDLTAESEPDPVPSQQPRLSLDTNLTIPTTSQLDVAFAANEINTDTITTTTTRPDPPEIVPTPQIHIETPHADQTEMNKIAEFLETLNVEPKESEKLTPVIPQEQSVGVAGDPIVTLADDAKDVVKESNKTSQPCLTNNSKIEITPIDESPQGDKSHPNQPTLADICYVTQPLDDAQKGRVKSQFLKSGVEIVSFDEGLTETPAEKVRKTSEPVNLGLGAQKPCEAESLEDAVRKLKHVSLKGEGDSGADTEDKEDKLKKARRRSSAAQSQDSQKESEIDKYVEKMANMQETRKSMIERQMFKSSQSSQGSEADQQADQSSNFHGPAFLDSGQIKSELELPDEKFDKMVEVEKWASAATVEADTGQITVAAEGDLHLPLSNIDNIGPIPENEMSSEVEEPGTKRIDVSSVPPEMMSQMEVIIDHAVRDGIQEAVRILSELQKRDESVTDPVCYSASEENVVEKLDQVLEEISESQVPQVCGAVGSFSTGDILALIPGMELSSENLAPGSGESLEGQVTEVVDLSSGCINPSIDKIADSNQPSDINKIRENVELQVVEPQTIMDSSVTTRIISTEPHTENEHDNTVTCPQVGSTDVMGNNATVVTTLTDKNNDVQITEEPETSAIETAIIAEASTLDSCVPSEPTPSESVTTPPVESFETLQCTSEAVREEKNEVQSKVEPEVPDESKALPEQESQEPELEIIAELETIQEEIDNLSTELDQMENTVTAANAAPEEQVEIKSDVQPVEQESPTSASELGSGNEPKTSLEEQEQAQKESSKPEEKVNPEEPITTQVQAQEQIISVESPASVVEEEKRVEELTVADEKLLNEGSTTTVAEEQPKPQESLVPPQVEEQAEPKEAQIEGAKIQVQEHTEELKTEVEPIVEAKQELQPVVEAKQEVEPIVEGKQEVEPIIEEKQEVESVAEKQMVEPVVEAKQEVEPIVEAKQELEPVVETKQEVEAVAEANQEVEPRVEANVEPVLETKQEVESIVEPKPEVEPIVEAKQDVEPVVEAKPEVAPIIEEKQEVEPVLEAKQEVEPVLEAKQEVEPVLEAKQEVEPVLEAKQEVEPLLEAKQDVEPVVEAKPEVAPIIEEKQEVEPVLEANQDVEPVVEAKPQVEPLIEPKQEVEPVLEAKQEVEPIVEAKQEVEPVLEAKQEVEPIVEAKQEVQPIVELKQVVEPIVELKQETEPEQINTDPLNEEIKMEESIQPPPEEIKIRDSPQPPNEEIKIEESTQPSNEEIKTEEPAKTPREEIKIEASTPTPTEDIKLEATTPSSTEVTKIDERLVEEPQVKPNESVISEAGPPSEPEVTVLVQQDEQSIQQEVAPPVLIEQPKLSEASTTESVPPPESTDEAEQYMEPVTQVQEPSQQEIPVQQEIISKPERQMEAPSVDTISNVPSQYTESSPVGRDDPAEVIPTEVSQERLQISDKPESSIPVPIEDAAPQVEPCVKTDLSDSSTEPTVPVEQVQVPDEPRPTPIAMFSLEATEVPISSAVPVATLEFETLSEPPPFPIPSSTQDQYITDNQVTQPDADTFTVSCGVVDQSSSQGAVMALTVELLDENSPEIFPLPSSTSIITSPVEKVQDDGLSPSPSVVVGVSLTDPASSPTASADQQATEASAIDAIAAAAAAATTITIAEEPPSQNDQLSSGKIVDDVPLSPPPPPTTPAVAQAMAPAFPISNAEAVSQQLQQVEQQSAAQRSPAAEEAPSSEVVVVQVTEAQPQQIDDNDKAKNESGHRERDAIVTAVKGIVEAFDASKPLSPSVAPTAPSSTEGKQATPSQSSQAQPEEDLEKLITSAEGTKKEDLGATPVEAQPAKSGRTREKTPSKSEKEVKFKLPPEELEDEEEEEEEVEIVRPPTPPKTLSKVKPKSPSPTPEPTVHPPTTSSSHRNHDELLISGMQTTVSGSAADTTDNKCASPTPPVVADTTSLYNNASKTLSATPTLLSPSPIPPLSSAQIEKVEYLKEQCDKLIEQSAAAAIAAAKAAGSPSPSPSTGVSVIGIEETASLISGERWDNRTPTPTFRQPTPPVPHRPPSPPEQIPSIYLEGPMPAKGQEFVVKESQVEVEGGEDYELDDDYEPSAPVILSGKVTLSVISSAGGVLSPDELTDAPSLSLDDRAQAENSRGKSPGSSKRNVAADIASAISDEVKGKSSTASSPDMDEYEVIGKSGFGGCGDEEDADVSLDDYLTATDADQDAARAQEDTAADISTMDDLKPEQLPQDEE